MPSASLVTRLLRGRRYRQGLTYRAARQSRVRQGRSFAEVLLARSRWHASTPALRLAVPGGGDLCGGEEHSAGVGARSALRPLACRSCLSAESEANEASCPGAARIRASQRSRRAAPTDEPLARGGYRPPCLPRKLRATTAPREPQQRAASRHLRGRCHHFSRSRAITTRWIWFVPSKICASLASRIMRSTG